MECLDLAGIDLADLFVHRDGADNKTTIVITLCKPGEALDGFGNITDSDIQISQSIDQGKIRWIFPDELLVLRNGMADLALDYVLVGRLQHFGFIQSHLRILLQKSE